MGFFDILSLPVVASCFLHIARDLSPMAKIYAIFQDEGGRRPLFSWEISVSQGLFWWKSDDFGTFLHLWPTINRCLAGSKVPQKAPHFYPHFGQKKSKKVTFLVFSSKNRWKVTKSSFWGGHPPRLVNLGGSDGHFPHFSLLYGPPQASKSSILTPSALGGVVGVQNIKKRGIWPSQKSISLSEWSPRHYSSWKMVILVTSRARACFSLTVGGISHIVSTS